MIERVEDLFIRMRWKLQIVKYKIKQQNKKNRGLNVIPEEISDDESDEFVNFGFRTSSKPNKD